MDKAAHLALLGFKPCVYYAAGIEREWRIKKCETDYEFILGFSKVLTDGWNIYGGGSVNSYVEVAWSEVEPDLASLPTDLMEEFILRVKESE